jgi:hypothetical protein
MSMELAPMKRKDYGRYVCVVHPEPAAGGCLRSPHITIRSDGVWVKQDTGPYGVPGAVMSAHRECAEAAQREQDDKETS